MASIFKRKRKVKLDNGKVYCLRLSFPLFKQSECENFQQAAFSIPADISFAFGKTARKLA